MADDLRLDRALRIKPKIAVKNCPGGGEIHLSLEERIMNDDTRTAMR